MSIKVENITKTYGEQTALNNLSFTISNGEIVGFLGPNGAGKSTLIKILTTYLKPTTGQAWVSDINVIKHPNEVQKIIGYLPEHNPLYLDLYVKEYLKFCQQIHQVSKSRVDIVIQLTGLSTEAHKKIGALSKGFRQRVGLAAALLHDPQILILDEPTTGLDPNQLAEIRQLIKQIGQDKTVFLSTHIMQEVEAICKRVLIINQGVLVANDNLKSLISDHNSFVEVEFLEPVNHSTLQKIKELKNIKRLEKNQWHLTFNTTQDPRALLFDFAKNNQLTILQMQQSTKNLETLFREKTKK